MAEGDLKCTVLFFAVASQAMGCRKKDISMQHGSTVGNVFDSLSNACEELAALAPICAFALDGQLTSRNTTIHDGCTIAILPPVSGG